MYAIAAIAGFAAAGALGLSSLIRIYASFLAAAHARDTHPNLAFKEDAGFIALRLLKEEEIQANIRQAWIKQLLTATKEALPGPYAYNPERPSGIVPGRQA